MLNLNAAKLKEMFIKGAEAVSSEYEYINELNVFPVPDGDTGTNMMVTINGAVDAIRNVDYSDIHLLGKQFSRGLLMNARGNSGVIFSQIIKGFTSVFKEGKQDIGVLDFANAFTAAKNIAYSAVAQPVEGTILTVIRVTAEKLNKKHDFKSVEEVMELACKEAQAILLKTPELLRELKEVGVVDSGGYGLCRFFDGMLLALKNTKTIGPIKKMSLKKIEAKKSFIEKFEDNDVGFGYCCEFILTLKARVSLKQSHKAKFNLKHFKKAFSKIGDSLAVVVDGNIVKVHVHTITPYKVLEIGAKFGEFNKVKIENMTLQFLERNPGTTLESIQDNIQSKKKIPIGTKIIATVPSLQIAKIFKDELNIAHTINTQVSGNPSIQEFVDKIREANVNNIIIVVDDSNIVLAAKEASELVANEVSIRIINAKNIASSYLACLSFDSEQDIDDNTKEMQKVISSTCVGKISVASKFVKYSHIDVKKNDYIGIIDKQVIVSERNIQETINKLCHELISSNKKAKFAYIINGQTAEIKDTKYIRKYLSETYNLQVSVINGGQEVYPFYIAIN